MTVTRLYCTVCEKGFFEVAHQPEDSVNQFTTVPAQCSVCGFKTVHRPAPPENSGEGPTSDAG